jgi:hypothetical protein
LFVRSSQADTVMSVMMDRVRPPSEVRPDLPTELDPIVLKAISRAPAQRYATAREMGRDLMKFCRESGVTVSPIEIEHLMERLFEKEIADSKQLLRKAKQGGGESGVWMEVTPSGFGRQPKRTSGAVEKGAWTTSQIDVVGDGTGSTSRRVPSSSMSAPVAEARATAAPEVTSAPASTSKRPLIVVAVLAACALVAGTWLVSRRLTPSSESIAVMPPLQSSEQPPVGAVNEARQNPEAEQPNTPRPDPVITAEPTITVEQITPPPSPTPAPRPAAPQRYEPPRRDARGRPVARPGASSPVAQREREQADSGNTAAARSAPIEEPAAREATQAAPGAAEHKDEPAAVAAVPPPVVAAPVAPAAPAAVIKPVPAAPAPPQRLEATASIADLDVEGSLGTGVVARMLGRVTSALKSCYGDAAKHANRNDFSPLPVELTIDEAGSVRNLSVGHSGLGDLSACASGALKRVRSERVPDVGTVLVKFRIAFTPQK